MFRDVPGCSGMFHVPGFIDALLLIPKRFLNSALQAIKDMDHVLKRATLMPLILNRCPGKGGGGGAKRLRRRERVCVLLWKDCEQSLFFFS